MATASPKVPAGFAREQFSVLQQGIADDPSITVLINEAGDFAALHPQPVLDYAQYQPRVEKLGLRGYKKTQSLIARRYEKIAERFGPEPFSLLEIGASDGAFLDHIRGLFPQCTLAAVEPDRRTEADRRKVVGEHSYESLEAILKTGLRFDVVCFFHVIEHITDPEPFLNSVWQLTVPGGHVIVEAPSLTDPLQSVYACEAHRRFYFQKQHPYVYSQRSLARLMEHHGFETQKIVSYQRYGLDNHLKWLMTGTPGGDARLRELFGDIEEGYIEALERHGLTDTVIWIGSPKRPD